MAHVEVHTTNDWSTACSRAFVPLRVRSATSSFRATLTQSVLAPGVTLTRVESAASEVYRSDRVIASSPRDDVLLSLHRCGVGSVRQHGREALLRPGTAALYDAASPYSLLFPGTMSEIVLQVPRRTLGVVGNAFEDLTARTLPNGGLMTALVALASAVDAPSSYRSSIGDLAIADSLVGLLRAVVLERRVDAPPPIDGQLLLSTMHVFIEEHLADATLSPERLALEMHVSLRLVQKLFASAGDTPAAYLRRRRLVLARQLLLGGESVSGAFRRSGFNDPDTFARAFKREWGDRPSEVAAASAAMRHGE